MYASKRRQRNFKRVREPTKPTTSSNPSKRHRERLNGELETVAQLLPYDQSTISRLDKLSVLRLAVSYLQAKAHFQACHHNSSYMGHFPLATHSYFFVPRPISFNGIPTIHEPITGRALIDPKEPDFESISLKALGGFLLVINENGDIYYASENVEHFLGFHQSDILHQPIFDLIHSEDREDIRQQLDITFSTPTASTSHSDMFAPENLPYLNRNVNARFRCLLDNTCGFLRIDMSGKLMSILGLPSSYVMGRSNSAPVMGLVAVCTPFVPPSTSDLAPEDAILKTKHHLDGTLVSMDEIVHSMLELQEADLPLSFYQIVHVDDALCLAEAHKEVLKNGSSGLLIYRLISWKTKRTYFVQSSCRMFYKNGKSESIGLTHRLLNEVEGMMLLEKRSSLKAKLLSFDDSFLQSPRNLQSTAALPLPAAKDDFDSDPTSFANSFSAPLPPSRFKKREDGVVAPSVIMPKLPLEQWQIIQQPMTDLCHFPIPTHDWNSWEVWQGELYPYQTPHLPVPYPQGLQPIPNLSYDVTNLDYHWNSANAPVSLSTAAPLALPDIVPLDESQSTPDKNDAFPHSYNKAVAEYATTHNVIPSVPHSSGFSLISEVTNTLLGQ